jgi:hypothetical protein
MPSTSRSRYCFLSASKALLSTKRFLPFFDPFQQSVAFSVLVSFQALPQAVNKLKSFSPRVRVILIRVRVSRVRVILIRVILIRVRVILSRVRIILIRVRIILSRVRVSRVKVRVSRVRVRVSVLSQD